MFRQKWNDGWSYKSGAVSMVDSFSQADEDSFEIELPHDAAIHTERTAETRNGNQTGFYPGGLYTYTKQAEIPSDWEGRTVILEFEGVQGDAKVFVNGDYAGGCHNGYTNFYVSLEHFLNYGEINEIKVVADDQEERSRWYSGAGIYRDVNLLVGGDIYFVPDKFKILTPDIAPDEAIADIEVQINNAGRKTARSEIRFTILDDKLNKVAEATSTYTAFSGTCGIVRKRLSIHEPKLWDIGHPYIYTAQVEIISDGHIIDTEETAFGIRSLTLSADRGLRVNGKEVKLRGACIHADNGILGAAAYADADERKIRLLKEAGFNCVRSSHHPMGKGLLDACDRIGMFVMDELSDMWTRSKNTHDYAAVFEESWRIDVLRMVEKDRNHPSVILYSTGNEIQEAGTAKGAQINREINELFKSLDPSRYTVSAINGLLAGQDKMGEILADAMGISPEELEAMMAMPSGNNENAVENQDSASGGADELNGMMSIMVGPLADAFATSSILGDMIEEYASVTDIAGYNYLTGLHEAEKERHPGRVVLGTETFPADIVRLWDIVKNNSHVIGDMTWAGYDYLGEAGCGIFHYDGTENFTSHWPDRLAYIGDLDINGYRRPISYLREIVYGLRSDPYIAVRRLNRNGQTASKTAWMWEDNIASWTWPGHEGKVAVVDVCADADEVELLLNGESYGKKDIRGQFKTTFEVPYHAGTLTAVSYRNGTESGRFSLTTADSNVHMNVCVDRDSLSARNRELAFITVTLTDDDGIDNLNVQKTITVSVEGSGELMAVGSADPQALRSYDDHTWETWDGRMMAVVRAGRSQGTVRVKLSAEDCRDIEIEIPVE